MKPRHKTMYMDIAKTVARSSYAVRKKVGAVIVHDDRILSIGYNGTLPGESNECEYQVQTLSGQWELVTKQNVLHAELNAIIKLARDGQSAKGSTMFLTLSPCRNCAALIIGAGISQVFYDEKYRDDGGILLLAEHGIGIDQWSDV